MSSHYLNTETKLTQDLKQGDTIVYVESAANWKKSTDSVSVRFLAIYPYKDYPIYTYARKYCAFTNSDANTITLSAPYSGTLVPAGTAVSDNTDGGYNYSTISGNIISNIWTNYSSANITGSVVNASGIQFRYGTKYIKLVLLLNYGQSSSYATVLDDIEFKDANFSIFDSKIQELCISNVARNDIDILNRYKTGILNKDSNVTYMLTEK
jgi:hypothetical protein